MKKVEHKEVRGKISSSVRENQSKILGEEEFNEERRIDTENKKIYSIRNSIYKKEVIISSDSIIAR